MGNGAGDDLMPKNQPLRIIDSKQKKGSGGSVVIGGSHTHDSRYWLRTENPPPATHDHGEHTGLADDDHAQYALLIGRSGGQTLTGGTGAGDNLRLQSTSHATKGDVIAGDPLLLETLTASRLLATDANKRTVSVNNLAAWIVGTANRVIVANNGDGTITLNMPQDLHPGATPTFVGVVTSYVAPTSDDTTAFQIRKADWNTAVVSVDTINGRFGINADPPIFRLDVRESTDEFATLAHFRNFSSGTSAAVQLQLRNDASQQFDLGILSTAHTQFPGYGLPGDAFLRSSAQAGNLNFISGNSSMSIRFFGGRNATQTPTLVLFSSNAGINVDSPTFSSGSGLDIGGQNLRIRSSRTPASSSATGNVGEICWDANYIYVCTATNTWRRVAINAW
jgi:hypothetical protein